MRNIALIIYSNSTFFYVIHDGCKLKDLYGLCLSKSLFWIYGFTLVAKGNLNGPSKNDSVHELARISAQVHVALQRNWDPTKLIFIAMQFPACFPNQKHMVEISPFDDKGVWRGSTLLLLLLLLSLLLFLLLLGTREGQPWVVLLSDLVVTI